MTIPFDVSKLRDLLAQASIDLLLVNTRHNVRYLTGGYYYHFNARATRAGTSQYLPFLGIPRGREADAFYIGGPGERLGLEATPIWVSRQLLPGGGTRGPAEEAVGAIRGLVGASATIGVELPFLPADAWQVLQRGLPHARFVDATELLHDLRAVKTEAELERIRSVSDRVAEAIQMTFRHGRPGVTTRELATIAEREMGKRDLSFLWAFTCAGPSYLRAPSAMTWEAGRVLHLDCGGEDGDYLADICRMGSLGTPSALAQELHAECLAVQDAARRMLRPGVSCADVASEGERIFAKTPHAEIGALVIHGIGMVSHEQPVIKPGNRRPLEAGMVLSIETEFLHPDVGHVKIEDTVEITADGNRGMGDAGREWQVV